MGYKLLGFIVWQLGKWYARRRLRKARRTVAAAGVTALVLAGVALAAERRRPSR